MATFPMSILAGVASLTGARTRGLRGPFLTAFAAAIVGCAGLWLLKSTSPLWLAAVAVTFFGLTQGLMSTCTQAAVYLQAPPGQVGTASGLQRTATYIGAIAATSLLGFAYGHHATDHGLHTLAVVMACASGALLIGTIFDRTLPRVIPSHPPHS